MAANFTFIKNSGTTDSGKWVSATAHVIGNSEMVDEQQLVDE